MKCYDNLLEIHEAIDIAHYEQMCIVLQWVDSVYNIHETAISLAELPDTKAITILIWLKIY